jgi:hypothetical protein
MAAHHMLKEVLCSNTHIKSGPIIPHQWLLDFSHFPPPTSPPSGLVFFRFPPLEQFPLPYLIGSTASQGRPPLPPLGPPPRRPPRAAPTSFSRDASSRDAAAAFSKGCRCRLLWMSPPPRTPSSTWSVRQVLVPAIWNLFVCFLFIN